MRILYYTIVAILAKIELSFQEIREDKFWKKIEYIRKQNENLHMREQGMNKIHFDVDDCDVYQCDQPISHMKYYINNVLALWFPGMGMDKILLGQNLLGTIKFLIFLVLAVLATIPTFEYNLIFMVLFVLYITYSQIQAISYMWLRWTGFNYKYILKIKETNY